LENTLASQKYVYNILAKFVDEPRLGMMTPPPPFHGLYFAHTIPTDWGSNYANTKTLLNKRLKLQAPMNPQKPTVSAIGSCFWFRREALLPLFEAGWSYNDFLPEGMMGEDGTISHAIERVNGYVAQARGYYPAWVLSDRYASIEIGSLWYSTSELVGALGPRRKGETLLELELWGNYHVEGLRERINRLGGRIHRSLRGVSKMTVRNMPKPVQEVIFRTAWFPLAAYRSIRHRIGSILHPRPQESAEIKRMTKKALTGSNK
jgi:rhamnosyltransferase